MINLGDNFLLGLRLGDKKINRAYMGNEKIFEMEDGYILMKEGEVNEDNIEDWKFNFPKPGKIYIISLDRKYVYFALKNQEGKYKEISGNVWAKWNIEAFQELKINNDNKGRIKVFFKPK